MTSGIPSSLRLKSERVRLESLEQSHLDGLWKIAQDPSLWTWVPFPPESREGLSNWFEKNTAAKAAGTAYAFAIFDEKTGEYAGSSSYLNRDPSNRRVEIGYTWITPTWQRSYVNTEAKLLLMGYAFETLGCARVEFKADALNTRSRQALLRIGAKEEGCLRRHMMTASGRIRDTVYFSVLDSEWPDVKLDLEKKLGR